MAKPLICKKCSQEFMPYIYVDGIRIARYRRRYCESCTPYASRRGNRNQSTTEDSCRQCKNCKKILSLDCFSFSNKRGNIKTVCKKCVANNSKASKNRFKEECVAYKGGKCSKCGYNKCLAAFDFHHIDKTKKDFQLSRCMTTILTDIVKKELDKCEILCANCHREEHYDIQT